MRRRVRVGVGVVVTVALGLGGHAMAGGVVLALAAPFAALLLFGPLWWLADREWCWAPIAGLLLGGQVVVHLTAVGVAAVFGHSGHGMELLPEGPMLVNHVVAALLAAGWLRLGERRLWRAARHATSRVAAAFRRLLDSSPPWFAVPCPVVVAEVAPLRPTPLRHVLVLRGPPVLD